jgi:hypothetical protein
MLSAHPNRLKQRYPDQIRAAAGYRLAQRSNETAFPAMM